VVQPGTPEVDPVCWDVVDVPILYLDWSSRALPEPKQGLVIYSYPGTGIGTCQLSKLVCSVTLVVDDRHEDEHGTYHEQEQPYHNNTWRPRVIIAE
jgi:hypothetical protein